MEGPAAAAATATTRQQPHESKLTSLPTCPTCRSHTGLPAGQPDLAYRIVAFHPPLRETPLSGRKNDRSLAMHGLLLSPTTVFDSQRTSIAARPTTPPAVCQILRCPVLELGTAESM